MGEKLQSLSKGRACARRFCKTLAQSEAISAPEASTFMRALQLLVLDEAHFYDGVFGTNMAYFLRRFQAASAEHQLICSTATLGRPANFVEVLTGRKPRTFGPDDDGSPGPAKTILLASPNEVVQ